MARPTYHLQGRTVLITGAARGIGAETARRLAARGARLALVGLEPERLEALSAELRGEHADRVGWWEADVSDAAAVQRAVGAAVERFGGLDVVMANAGIAPPQTTVAVVDPAAFERVIDVNLLGVWRTVRATLPHVRARRGYLLLIASMAAAVHPPLMAPYNMAKAGVEALADSLRPELAGDGVDVGCAYFGFIDTDMVRDAFAQPGAQKAEEMFPSFVTKRLKPSVAGTAIVDGIQSRAHMIIRPRWWRIYSVLRGIFNPLLDRRAERDERVRESILENEELRREEAAVREAAD